MKLARLFSPVLVLILFTACSKNDDTGSTSNPPPGSWKVNFYWDEKDETTDFTGYSFVFNAGGTITVTKNGTTYPGTWSETSNKFILNFGADPVLSELNDDWQKTEKTSTSIKLKDDNPAQDDQLHFIKL